MILKELVLLLPFLFYDLENLLKCQYSQWTSLVPENVMLWYDCVCKM